MTTERPASCSVCEANETPGFVYAPDHKPDVGTGAPATLMRCDCQRRPDPLADPPVVTPRTEVGYAS